MNRSNFTFTLDTLALIVIAIFVVLAFFVGWDN